MMLHNVILGPWTLKDCCLRSSERASWWGNKWSLANQKLPGETGEERERDRDRGRGERRGEKERQLLRTKSRDRESEKVSKGWRALKINKDKGQTWHTVASWTKGHRLTIRTLEYFISNKQDVPQLTDESANTWSPTEDRAAGGAGGAQGEC